MVWTILKQQQQRGSQFSGGDKPPKEAVEDRAAQDHEQAGGTSPQAGESPASRLEDREGENTPSAPDEPDPDWDNVVQPERRQQQGERHDDQPPPDGK